MISQTLSIEDDKIAQDESYLRVGEALVTIDPSRKLLYLNAASLKTIPIMEYALILISSSEKRLCIYLCETGERDAMRMRSGGKHRNKPHQLRCREELVEKILTLMNWNCESRYKIAGYIMKAKSDVIIIFDLSVAKVFARTIKEGESVVYN
jgi:hypothetical protein